jgi:hypothetical protein
MHNIGNHPSSLNKIKNSELYQYLIDDVLFNILLPFPQKSKNIVPHTDVFFAFFLHYFEI